MSSVYGSWFYDGASKSSRFRSACFALDLGAFLNVVPVCRSGGRLMPLSLNRSAEVNEIDGFGIDVAPEHVEVVAVIQTVQHGGSLGPLAWSVK